MADPISQKTEAEAVAAIVKSNNTPIHFPSRGGVVVFPNGTKVNLEDERLDSTPKRKRAKVALVETHSFVEYLNAHKVSDVTHVFAEATEQGGKFVAIIDYHAKQGSPGWGEHSCSLTLATTPEWQRWMANNNRALTQEAFAEFLEENMNDIVNPDAGTLIDMAQMLQGKKHVAFKSGKNLKNGAIQFEYSEQIETTGGRVNGDMQLPDRFTIGIVPFVGAAGIEVSARLRFRISDGGKLTFAYILDRPFKVIEAAFILARQEIEEKTGLPVHLGTAEVIGPKVL